MISYFYKDDYEDGNTENLDINTYGISKKIVLARHRYMLNDISVYAIADKYCIPNLKELAISKFRSLAYSVWPHYDFPAIVISAYDSTPDNDEELRDTVATICARHIDDVLQDKSSSALKMKNIGIIGFDMLKKVKAISDGDYDYVYSTLHSVEEELNEKKEELKSLFDSMCARCSFERVTGMLRSVSALNRT